MTPLDDTRLIIQAAIFLRNFETSCHDFDIDRNWVITDGLHPQPIDHDHTLYNTSSRHYLYFNHQNGSHFQISELKTKEWIQPSINRTNCFRIWYFTTELNFPFNIQLLEDYDEQLTRIVASIPGKDPTLNDWTLVNLTLPNEQIKIAIRLMIYLNSSKSCDSNISDDTPSIDYTFLNQTGHYIWLPNSQLTEVGNVGNLKVYAWISGEYDLVQQLWPLKSNEPYLYTQNKW
ncbi:hypothetical protein I4U23_026982 [Adineta vaga]|nr:hypothetical protein I4U23_026982 [Adineta vaga]